MGGSETRKDTPSPATTLKPSRERYTGQASLRLRRHHQLHLSVDNRSKIWVWEVMISCIPQQQTAMPNAVKHVKNLTGALLGRGMRRKATCVTFTRPRPFGTASLGVLAVGSMARIR